MPSWDFTHWVCHCGAAVAPGVPDYFSFFFFWGGGGGVRFSGFRVLGFRCLGVWGLGFIGFRV